MISTNTQDTSGLQSAFRALGDPTRRQILLLLRDRDMTVQELSDRFPVTRAAIKKHLTILETGNLISAHPVGRERINKLNPTSLKKANDWFDHFSRFWDDRLIALKDVVETSQQPGTDLASDQTNGGKNNE